MMNENQTNPDDIQQILDILSNIDEKSQEASEEIPEEFKDFWEDVIWDEEET